MKPPKHPRYKDLKSRLDSFVGWPSRYVPQTPASLAASGFFYIGSADRVTCFQCGITLRDWEEQHDPATEHKKYSKDCEFINNPDLDDLGVETRPGSLPRTRDDRTPEAQSYPSQEGACSDVPNSREDIGGASSGTSFQFTQESEPVSSTSSERRSPENKGSTSRLVEENRRLRERNMCRQCKVKDVSVLFLPCGHLVTCSDCAVLVEDCIVCGKTVVGTVKTFFS